MLYGVVRVLVRFALGLFYRLETVSRAGDLDGPVMLVGNHPNSLIDPALVFVVTRRQVTFLAKEPLFRTPVFGWLLRALGALPVYRKQDHPGLMEKNEGTLETAAKALVEGRAITIFPEGKSHSEPQLAEIKTGCARIALKAARGGATVRIVPVGLTYAQKQRFRSRVHLEVGTPLELPAPPAAGGDDEVAWVQTVTARVSEALRTVTLNLEQWADLELIETAEQLYSLRLGEQTRDPERVRRFARGVELYRAEHPEAFEAIRDEVMSFRSRLQLVNASPDDLDLQYRRPEVARFVGRSLASLLLGLPLFALGLVLFAIPFYTVRIASRVVPLAPDRVATLKFVGALVMTPLWQALLSYVGLRLWGTAGLLVSALMLPLAMFTRYFIERWRGALGDIRTFFTLGNRGRLKALLLVEGERLAEEIDRVASELRPRVVAEPPPGSA
ncbi:MAG: lysophospholipid acyltransferase family protein [Myxococcaceae bacterium]|nr:lysophospholipid acyltransferase family protein [Myxococcaceae bacterium]